MMKIFYKNLSKIVLVVGLLSVTGCSKESSSENQNFTLSRMEPKELKDKLADKYGIVDISYGSLNDNSIKEAIRGDIDFEKLQISGIKQYVLESGNQIVILPFKENNLFKVFNLAKKGQGVYVIEKSFSVEYNLDQFESGSLSFIHNDKTRDLIRFEKGNVINADSPLQKESVSTSAVQVCQREGSEGIDGCYKREVNELCDGFFGCISLVYAGTHVAILALCSCHA